jgi:hypothetical protein
MTIFRRFLYFGREPTSPHLPGVAQGHQFVIRQPVVIFFSSAYLAAASLIIGAITLSSLTYQSEVIFQFLPSQV